jgi:hypothetical protein
MTNDGSACAAGPDKVVYRTAVGSTEDGRSGLVHSEDGQLDLALALLLRHSPGRHGATRQCIHAEGQAHRQPARYRGHNRSSIGLLFAFPNSRGFLAEDRVDVDMR